MIADLGTQGHYRYRNLDAPRLGPGLDPAAAAFLAALAFLVVRCFNDEPDAPGWPLWSTAPDIPDGQATHQLGLFPELIVSS